MEAQFADLIMIEDPEEIRRTQTIEQIKLLYNQQVPTTPMFVFTLINFYFFKKTQF